MANLNGCAMSATMNINQMIIGFDADWDGDREIYTIRGDGSDLKQLTENNVDDFTMTWSPDRKMIAFRRTIEINDNTTFPLFVMDNDGSKETQLTPPGFSVYPSFAWSPDAQRIVFVGKSDDDTVGIYVISVDGSLLSAVFNDTTYINVGHPTWAPDGTTLAFEATDDPKLILWYLYSMKSDGSDLHKIGSKGLTSELPEWHPLENKILFVSQPEPKPVPFQLFTIKPDGTGQKQLTDSRVDKWNALWSPDGQMVSYIATIDRYSPHPKTALHILNADGTNDVTIFETQHEIHSPKWAPDNRHIAFTSTESGSTGLYVIDICDGSIHRIVEKVLPDTTLDWMP